jgi:hypothetical protein
VLTISGFRKYALGGSIMQASFIGGENEKDLNTFLVKYEEAVRDFLQRSMNQHRLVKQFLQ